MLDIVSATCHRLKSGLRLVLRLILTPLGTDVGFVRITFVRSRHYSRAGVALLPTGGLS